MMAGAVSAVAVLAVGIIWVIRQDDLGAAEQAAMALAVPLILLALDKMGVLNQEV